MFPQHDPPCLKAPVLVGIGGNLVGGRTNPFAGGQQQVIAGVPLTPSIDALPGAEKDKQRIRIG